MMRAFPSTLPLLLLACRAGCACGLLCARRTARPGAGGGAAGECRTCAAWWRRRTWWRSCGRSPAGPGARCTTTYYEVSLPDGRKETAGASRTACCCSGRGAYPPGQEARLGIVVNYDAAGGSRVSSGEETADLLRQGRAADAGAPTPTPAGSFSLSTTATAAEGGSAGLTITLNEAAPASKVWSSRWRRATPETAAATAEDVGSMTSPVTVHVGGSSSLDIAHSQSVDDRIDEDDESFTVVIATDAGGLGAGWRGPGHRPR